MAAIGKVVSLCGSARNHPAAESRGNTSYQACHLSPSSVRNADHKRLPSRPQSARTLSAICFLQKCSLG